MIVTVYCKQLRNICEFTTQEVTNAKQVDWGPLRNDSRQKYPKTFPGQQN